MSPSSRDDHPSSNLDAVPTTEAAGSSSATSINVSESVEPAFPFSDFKGNWKSLPDVLYFSSGKDSTVSWLSNFHPAKITVGGKEYHHVEGWFQACKFMEVDEVLEDSEIKDDTKDGNKLDEGSKAVVEVSNPDAEPTQKSLFTTEDRAYAERIRLEKNPRSVKALGRRRKMNAAALSKWEHGKKMAVMLAGLKAKFGRNGTELRQKLLATGNRPLAEQVRGDKTWGIGAKGDGKNLLGVCLMRVREEIRREEEAKQEAEA